MMAGRPAPMPARPPVFAENTGWRHSRRLEPRILLDRIDNAIVVQPILLDLSGRDPLHDLGFIAKLAPNTVDHLR
jgi:hypothetical protein